MRVLRPSPPQPTIRTRLTLAYALLFAASTGLVLGMSWWLLERHLSRTLPDATAADAMAEVGTWYALAFGGSLLVAAVAGWALAGRALAPLGRMAGTARRVSGERLDERVALEGPRDELRDLADALDGMLDGLSESFDTERRFAATASHELRGPLTVIRSEAEVTLADPEASREELRAMGEAVVEASERTDALLEGLMALARSRQALLRREEVDLAPGARAAAAAVAEEARAADVRVRVQAGPAVTVGDRRLLERLAANLVENAVRHNRRGGTVQVETARRNGDATLTVVNTGPPIPADQAERLTLPFERLGGADGRGAGLGLSIVKAVAEAHEGRLTLAPRPEGGLSAEVALPAPPSA